MRYGHPAGAENRFEAPKYDFLVNFVNKNIIKLNLCLLCIIY